MANPPERMAVVVAYSPGPREVVEWQVEVPPGATVNDALTASGFSSLHPMLDPVALDVGVWGQPARLEQPLRPRDRVEVYRALQVDPKVARRERFRQQGIRSAGLFAKKKAGSAAGP